MSSSPARRHRGLTLATAALAVAAAATVVVASCALALTSSGTATAEPAPSASGSSAETAPADGVRTLVTDETEAVEGGERGVARSRTVKVDTAALPDNAAEAAQQIALPLFDDTTVVVDLSAPTLRSKAGYRTWNGTIDGDKDSTVVLVEQAGVLSGMVSSKDATYRLRPMPDGRTRIEQVDASQFPDEEDVAVPTPEADTGGVVQGTTGVVPPTVRDSDAPVIDVLIAYSTAAKTREGGQAVIDADVALMIEQTNSAFTTSGINASVRLVHSAEVALNSPVNGTTLGKLAGTTDGVYDELHVLRDQYGADLVALITDNPGGSACGIGYLMNNVSPSFAGYGFSVTDTGCATGNMSFTHELGHNFGASHDRAVANGTAPWSYGYGWVNAQQGWRTVMAYANACPTCVRLLRFSNPDLTYSGAPTGAPAGAANAADNRSVLNMTASTVAGFRGGAAPASLTLTAPTTGQRVIASGKLSATWSTSGYLGSDAKVELLRGGILTKVLTSKVALGTGRYDYVVPLATARGDDYRLRVTPLLALQYAVTSDVFSVVDPSFTPAFTSAAAAGGTARVTWTYTGAPGGTVKVELLKDGKLLAVLKSAAVLGTGGAGGVDVTLPAALNNGAGYQFRTTLSALPKAPAVTDEFSVASTRQLVVTSPVSGTTATAGAPLTVAWTASGELGVSVKAELVKGDLVVFTSPVTPTAGGSLTFTVPAKLPTGDDYKVRLVPVSFPTVIATRGLAIDGTSVTVTSQSTPASVIAGQRIAITFATVGVPGTAVKLEAVSPPLGPVTVVASLPLATGAYDWPVPVNLPKGDWKIRATVVGNTLVSGTSAASITVGWPQVSASASSSGVAGAPVTVSWAFTDGAVAPVRIRLMQGTRAVSTLTTSGQTSSSGTGSLTYRLPVNLAPGSYEFEVAPAANTAILGTTSVAVVRPTLASSGASSVVRGQTATIAWSFSSGAAAPVRIDLVQGTKVLTVKSGAVTADDGTGSFVYQAPATLAPGTYTLRIRPVLLAASNVVEVTRTFTVT
jgi:peptidyl-Asp metalloendopeptidase